MKNKNPNVMVGISAFNEELNIAHILRDLIKQKINGFVIEKILVVSDGSTDKTSEIVKKFKSKKIDLLDDKLRNGLAFRQNQIFSLAKTDVVVLIQADTRIKDKLFIQKLIKPIINKEADLTAARLEELKSDTWVSNSLDWSMKLKKSIYSSTNNGQSVYTCYGPARAFSKKLYSSIKFKHSVGEDAFSYFYGLSKKMKFQAVSEASIFYKLPQKLSDHITQSLRFNASKIMLEKEFGASVVKNEYALPGQIVLYQILKYILISPISFVEYFFITMVTILMSFIQNESNDIWKISKSSKELRNLDK